MNCNDLLIFGLLKGYQGITGSKGRKGQKGESSVPGSKGMCVKTLI